jgi:hypothetical protein
MAKPIQEPKPKQETVFRPVVQPVVETIVAAPVVEAPVEKVYEQLAIEPVMEVPTHVPSAESTIARQQPPATYADLPPVRRVTVPQERVQQPTMPVVQWAMQPERRRVPREPIVFPRGLNKAALRMQEKGQAIAKGQAGPSLTAAEQAVANKVSSTQHPIATQPVARREESSQQAVEQGGRWSLLRQFGKFETEEQKEPRLEDRATG